ncbi:MULTISPECIES: winged helix-turn-helix domain-containing protein [Methylobacterium]|uniref:winged helix-turn-helix domain-containing protein n=1 Tax=Methylobacterium TaxID=407 RepID=UPI000348ABAE|nr:MULTISPECIES: winged helix-turn-helix domain-containing protein [Methylobacterium]MBN4093871.1 winged helix-turn-helix domain-containing protein [Methylobacterium sp. OT2]UIN33688.1 winged helix-turn-helix domain-containing protein [Methylobacterium oryzae]SEG11713.1 DNA-binding response regulator, OmpR family, contains REC and winged-helix (wHTH) domain [Methylobacterium sp. 190mf]
MHHHGLRILLVDDDAEVQRVVSGYLDGHGVDVVPASTRAEARGELADPSQFNLVVLNLRPGAENGLDLLRDLRAVSDVPVILTTAHRCEEFDRVLGLELGADDYIVKPYGLREFLARVRVVLRRVAAQASSRPAEAPCRRFDGWVLNRRRRRLINPDGKEVVLGKRDYALLAAFLDAPQRPLTREYLLQVTRVHDDVFDRCIDVQILRLRRKIERRPSDPKLIVTERGVGYVFAAAVESTSH